MAASSTNPSHVQIIHHHQGEDKEQPPLVSDEERDLCFICLDPLTLNQHGTVILWCGHQLHITCFLEFIGRSQSDDDQADQASMHRCPVCRRSFSKDMGDVLEDCHRIDAAPDNAERSAPSTSHSTASSSFHSLANIPNAFAVDQFRDEYSFSLTNPSRSQSVIGASPGHPSTGMPAQSIRRLRSTRSAAPNPRYPRILSDILQASMIVAEQEDVIMDMEREDARPLQQTNDTSIGQGNYVQAMRRSAAASPSDDQDIIPPVQAFSEMRLMEIADLTRYRSTDTTALSILAAASTTSDTAVRSLVAQPQHMHPVREFHFPRGPPRGSAVNALRNFSTHEYEAAVVRPVHTRHHAMNTPGIASAHGLHARSRHISGVSARGRGRGRGAVSNVSRRSTELPSPRKG